MEIIFLIIWVLCGVVSFHIYEIHDRKNRIKTYGKRIVNIVDKDMRYYTIAMYIISAFLGPLMFFSMLLAYLITK